MSWMCPHDQNGRCARREAPCEAGQPGCVLEGRLAPPPWTVQETATVPQDHVPAPDELRAKTIEAMKTIFGQDVRRIEHSLKVLSFAEEILAKEPGSREVVVAAAILHDIGIHEAERVHGSAAGKYQEIEGPPIARRIMETLGYSGSIIDHVCRIVANHHSARDIDTPEFRIIWDADWLVNLPEEFPNASRSCLEDVVRRVFRTPTGRAIASARYLGGLGDTETS